MALGYDGRLFILAFDHRGSFQKKWFGLEGDPSPADVEKITDAKHLIYEGMEKAVEQGAKAGATGVLIDEQFGGDIPRQAKERGLKLAMPVEKSGQDMFDFQYGELALSASRIGTCTRIPLATWIAFSGPSMPTWTCSPKMISCRATKRRLSISSR